ncbi:CHASE domain-containing protein [Lentibacter sp. XHP0401]|uniref:CHASE domain-containing protein n=1 Tax=Lentibacter sp. XHP0401 TaxID=2984334 RepID=UPI0021E72471|nr:CHASE domain-containing protein [Lentibacter sp. XHP0401]MCV2894241.1 CHASE domain-containing protein [Lentibacter sp. XHP0401]
MSAWQETHGLLLIVFFLCMSMLGFSFFAGKHVSGAICKAQEEAAKLFAKKGYRASVFAVVVAITIAFTAYFEHVERNRASAVFTSFADESAQVLLNRLDGYVGTLNGAAALVLASDEVSQRDWQRYVEELDLEQRQSEILGLGYIVLVSEATGYDMSKEALESGVSLPAVHPDTGRDERYVIKFIEPISANRAALGLDIAFEENRRRAAELSREMNKVRLSQPIELVQDTKGKVAYLLLRPIYKQQAEYETEAGSGDGFLGWAYMPIIGEILFETLSEQQGRAFTLNVYDGSSENEISSRFSDGPESSAAEPLFEVTRNIDAFGRKWTLVWQSTPAFESASSSIAKWAVLLSGLPILLLLHLIMETISQRELRIETDVALKTKEIRAKNEENQSIIDNAVFSICVLDENDRIIFGNQAAKSLLGEVNISQEKEISSIITFSDEVEAPHGSARPARLSEQPERRLMIERNDWSTADGVARSTLLIQDVSEREESARRLAANEKRWNLALEGAQIGVFDVNLETQKSVVSDSWLRLMRVPDTVSDFDTQAYFMSLVHPDDRESLRELDRKCIDGVLDRSVAEYRVVFDDGEVRWMKSDAVVVTRDANGRALRLLGAQTDITAFREARDALKASQKRFEFLIEQAPVGMALFNKRGKFLGMNAALCDLTGYSEEEMFSGLRFRDLISDEDFSELLDAFEKLDHVTHSSLQGEYLIFPKTGPATWGLLSVAWTYDPSENDDVFIVQVIDISDKKNIEKMKSEFIATVSHELRTPLTSIKGALGLMQVSMIKDMPKGAARLVEIASSNADRLAALVNDILDLEKISSGEVAFDVEPSSMTQLLSDSVEQMHPFAEQHKTSISLKVPEKDVRVLMDSNRTQQAIVNLLSNACKYSFSDTVVQVHLEELEGEALVCILNDGPTITDEFKSRIFKPFSQADASDTRAKGGTGLGLNITKQIIERMDGRIGFSSKEASPTAFWFTLPLAQLEQADQGLKPVNRKNRASHNVLQLKDDNDFL